MPILVSVKKNIHLQDDLRKDSRTMEFNALVNKVCQKMIVIKHQAKKRPENSNPTFTTLGSLKEGDSFNIFWSNFQPKE